MGAKALKWLTGYSGVRRFRRRSIPCLLDASIPVYVLEQPISLMHAKGPEFYSLRARMVSDLMWLRDKAQEGTLHSADDMETDYKLARTVDDVREFLAEFGDDPICWDIETGNAQFEKTAFPFKGCNLVMIGLSGGPGHARVIPYEARGIGKLHYWTREELAEIHALLKPFWKKHTFFGHNAVQFDQKWNLHYWPGEAMTIDFDTMYVSHLLDEEPGGHKLEYLTTRHTKMPPWKSTFTLKDTKKLYEYNARDVDATYRVRLALEPLMNEAQWWLHRELQIPLGHEFRRMEYRGIRVSMDNLDLLGSELEKIISKATSSLMVMDCVKAFELQKNKSLNPDSPHDVAYIMEHILKLPKVKETGTGLYSTDKEVLDHYSDVPFVSSLQLRRRAGKQHSTYFCSIKGHRQTSEYIHTNYLLHGTVTGRPAARNPNLLNQTREDTAQKAGLEDGSLIKGVFIPSVWKTHNRLARMGVLLQADYSQAEIRVLAMYSQCPRLVAAYQAGLDIHTATAASAYDVPMDKVNKEMRSAAKIVNFGIIYGKGEPSLIADFVKAARAKARKLRIPFTADMELEASTRALDFLNKHKQNHPAVWSWMAQQEYTIRTQGYQETFFGRRRRYYRIDNAAIRQAYNFPIQSTASEFTLIALARLGRITRELGFAAVPVLTVYDSILWDCPQEEMWELADVCKQIMENLEFPFMAGVPMVADFEVGMNWGRLKSMNLDTREIQIAKGVWKKVAA